MKNDKFCFDKTVGVVVLVLVVVFLLVGSSTSLLTKKTTMNSRASVPKIVAGENQRINKPEPLTFLEKKNLPYLRNEADSSMNFTGYDLFTKSIGCGIVELEDGKDSRVTYEDCNLLETCVFDDNINKSTCISSSNIEIEKEFSVNLVKQDSRGAYINVQPNANGNYYLPVNELGKYYIQSRHIDMGDNNSIIIVQYSASIDINSQTKIKKEGSFLNKEDKSIYDNFQYGLDIEPLSLPTLNVGSHKLKYILGISDVLSMSHNEMVPKFKLEKEINIVIQDSKVR